MFLYHAYGLTLRADVPMPGLAPAHGAADVCLHRKKVEAPLAGAPASLDEASLSWHGWATVRVRAGREIIYDAPEQTEESWLRQCLLGPAFGVLLHQRGLLVLHASAVAIDGTAAIFVGHKGEGKSTTAAALHARGHPLLADDVVAVDVSDPAHPTVVPGFPQIKLWPDAAEAVQAPAEALAPFHSQLEKQIWHLPAGASPSPVPVRQLYVLARGDAHRLDPLAKKEALAGIMQFMYAPRFVGLTGLAPIHFKACADLVRSIPVARLTRKSSLALLPDTLDLILKGTREA